MGEVLLLCAPTILCVSLHQHQPHSHWEECPLYICGLPTILQPCEIMNPALLTQADVWLKNEWKAVKRHSVRETSMSGWISAPHILIGHGGSQGPEQGWVYRWSSDKAMGLGTRKVSISSVFSGTTRHLNCAKQSWTSLSKWWEYSAYSKEMGLLKLPGCLKEGTEVQNILTSWTTRFITFSSRFMSS